MRYRQSVVWLFVFLFFASCGKVSATKSDRDTVPDSATQHDDMLSDDDSASPQDDLLDIDTDTETDTGPTLDNDIVPQTSYRIDFLSEDPDLQEKITVLTPPNAPNGKYLDGTEVTVVFNDLSRDILGWEMNGRAIPHPARDFSTVISFKGAYYLLAGNNGSDRLNDVWKITPDGSWVFISFAPFPERSSHAAVIFKDAIWISGGANDSNNSLDDLWYSPDFRHWEKIMPIKSFGGRSGHAMASFKGALYILAGRDTRSIYTSPDGYYWEFVAPTSPEYFSERSRLTAWPNGDTLYLFGGTTVDDSALDEIWASGDAAYWEQVVGTIRFAPRGNISIVQFKERYYLVGGYPGNTSTGGYSDLWVSDDLREWEQVTPQMHSSMNAFAPELFATNEYLYLTGIQYGGYNTPHFLWRSTDGVEWAPVSFSLNQLTITATEDASYSFSSVKRYYSFTYTMDPSESAEVLISPELPNYDRIPENTILTVTIKPAQNRMLTAIGGNVDDVAETPLTFTVQMNEDKNMQLTFATKGSRLWEEVPMDIPFATLPIAGNLAQFGDALHYMAFFRGEREIDSVMTDAIWSESWLSFDGEVWDYIQKDEPVSPIVVVAPPAMPPLEVSLPLFASDGQHLFFQYYTSQGNWGVYISVDGAHWHEPSFYNAVDPYADLFVIKEKLFFWTGGRYFFEGVLSNDDLILGAAVPQQTGMLQNCTPYLSYPSVDERLIVRAYCNINGVSSYLDFVSTNDQFTEWQGTTISIETPDPQSTVYAIPFLEIAHNHLWVVTINSKTFNMETYRSADGFTWNLENLFPCNLLNTGSVDRENHATAVFKGYLWRLDQYEGVPPKLYRMKID